MIKYALIILILLAVNVESQSQNSVLSNGNWFKISFKDEGMYCLTYSDLQSLGMNLNVVDPRSIAMYGNKAGMLPLLYSASPVHDLQEMSILIKGESDGSFDPGDTIFFYGQSQDERLANLQDKYFTHRKNIYSDSTFYFLTVKQGFGRRMNINSTLPNWTVSVSEYNEYEWLEKDSMNPIRSGQEWLGDELNLNYTPVRNFAFDISHISPGAEMLISYKLAGRTLMNGTFVTATSGSNSKQSQLTVVGNSPQDPYMSVIHDSLVVLPPVNSGNIEFEWQSTDTSARGYIDFVDVNYINKLEIYKPQQIICNLGAIGAGNIVRYQLSNAPIGLQLYDVTDPLHVSIQQFQSAFPSVEFNAANDSLHVYLALDGHTFLTPFLNGLVQNQNFHAINHANNIIITADEFVNEANALAAFHLTHDGLLTVVANTSQIYNEYSSGSQDPVAIRNFIRQVYDGSAAINDSLKYVLLFGSGSYDFRGRLGYHSSLVPTFETGVPFVPLMSHCVDEFYTYMNDTSTQGYTNEVCIGIGRIPARNPADAEVVNRIIDYGSNHLGSWRKRLVAVGDDGAMNTFFKQLDTLSTRIENYYCGWDINKIYFDSYLRDTLNGHYYFPEAFNDLRTALQQGCLTIQYCGYGGPLGWAQERMLDSTFLLSTTNNNCSPLFINQTSEFNRFDDPAVHSCGQIISTGVTGTGIGSIGSARMSFSTSDYQFNSKFLEYLFKTSSNAYLRLGDIFRKAKNYSRDLYIRHYVLLGDPALKLNYPENEIVITEINGNAVSGITDTLQPGQPLQLTGEIHDSNGSLMSNFNGTAEILLFDQKTLHYTLANDPLESVIAPFYEWDDTLALVSTPVINGIFDIAFNLPWAIDSGIGQAKISLYASDNFTDASGCYENLVHRNLTFGIDELPDLEISIYPNPSPDKITFEFKNSESNNLYFSLTNLAGQIISESRITNRQFVLNKNQIAKGVYNYRIFNTKNNLVKKGKIIFN